MRSCFAFLALVASTLACTSASETTYVDVGSVCMMGGVDEPQTVTVDFLVCLSSSCDEIVESTCEAEFSGPDLTITASATIRSEGGACTADCVQSVVTCLTAPMPAGNYQLTYGELQGPLVVPSATGEPTCFGAE